MKCPVCNHPLRENTQRNNKLYTCPNCNYSSYNFQSTIVDTKMDPLKIKEAAKKHLLQKQ